MKQVQSILLLTILLLTAYLTVRIYQGESEIRNVREEVIELSRIKYGLFNVDTWKDILSGILAKKIDEFDFSSTNRPELRQKISDFLTSAITDFESRYHKENSGSIPGFLRSGVASLLDIFGKMKADVPVFTEQILDFMEEPENRRALKQFVRGKMEDYASKTFAEMDYSVHDAILEKYQSTSRIATKQELGAEAACLQAEVRPWEAALLGCALVLAGLCIFAKRFSKPDYLLSTLVCLCLLFSGLVLPMISIDARISALRLQFLGELVAFEDQVLYYKSKSILEVVDLMLGQGAVDIFLVGILVLLFSVIFPVAKLASSLCYVYFGPLRSKPFIRFMVFRTGKWSMADVMVVAIFMAYIGFTGILSEQLRQIEHITRRVEILTTNQSTLQTGFFLFTAFVILSLLLSQKLQGLSRQAADDQKDKPKLIMGD